MHSLEGMYWKSITYAFEMSLHNSTDIALAVEGHKLWLHNVQFRKNKNGQNLKLCNIENFHILL